MAEIEWTAQRAKAFEEAHAKGMNKYILDQGIKRGSPRFFVGMAIVFGFMDGWRPSFFFVVLPFFWRCSPCSLVTSLLAWCGGSSTVRTALSLPQNPQMPNHTLQPTPGAMERTRGIDR